MGVSRVVLREGDGKTYPKVGGLRAVHLKLRATHTAHPTRRVRLRSLSDHPRVPTRAPRAPSCARTPDARALRRVMS